MFLTAAASRIPQNGGLQVLSANLVQLEALAPDEALRNLDSYLCYVTMVNRLDDD